jgi:hypothetical protein
LALAPHEAGAGYIGPSLPALMVHEKTMLDISEMLFYMQITGKFGMKCKKAYEGKSGLWTHHSLA